MLMQNSTLGCGKKEHGYRVKKTLCTTAAVGQHSPGVNTIKEAGIWNAPRSKTTTPLFKENSSQMMTRKWFHHGWKASNQRQHLLDITATRCYDAVYNLSGLTLPTKVLGARVERDTHLAVEVLEVAGVLQKQEKKQQQPVKIHKNFRNKCGFYTQLIELIYYTLTR